MLRKQGIFSTERPKSLQENASPAPHPRVCVHGVDTAPAFLTACAARKGGNAIRVQEQRPSEPSFRSYGWMAPVARIAAEKHCVCSKQQQFITGSSVAMTIRNHEAKHTAEFQQRKTRKELPETEGKN